MRLANTVRTLLALLVLTAPALAAVNPQEPEPVTTHAKRTTRKPLCPDGYRERTAIIGKLGEDGKLRILGVIRIMEKC